MIAKLKEVYNNLLSSGRYSHSLEIEERVLELMHEGKKSPLRGWSAKAIVNTIEQEYNTTASKYAWEYIKDLYGHGDK